MKIMFSGAILEVDTYSKLALEVSIIFSKWSALNIAEAVGKTLAYKVLLSGPHSGSLYFRCAALPNV